MTVSEVDRTQDTSLGGQIAAFLRSFTEADAASRLSIQKLCANDPTAFCETAIPLLAAETSTSGSRYLVHLLLKEGLLVRALTDPYRCHRDKAVPLVKKATPMPLLEGDLERALAASIRSLPGRDMDARIARILDLLEAASAERRCLLFQSELLEHSNATIRAKAALLVARNSKAVSVVSRLMLDPDPRVQANAIEALWSFDSTESAPLLHAAAKSRVPRVAANALVGLYRIGDLAAIRMLWEMAQSPDPPFRDDGIWAMGETGDTRFLPFLTDLIKRGVGRGLAIGAIARIRARWKEFGEPVPVEIRIHDVEAENDGARKVSFGLWGSGLEVSAVRPINFAVTEDGSDVDDFTLTARINPAILMTGFVVPRIATKATPYWGSICEAIKGCLRYKRNEDLWRIDRFCVRDRLSPSERAKNPLPYDESLGGPNVKAQRGFFTEAERVANILAQEGTVQQAGHELPATLERVIKAMQNLSGSRHLFAFLESESTEFGPHPQWTNDFAETLEDARVRLHVIAPPHLDGDGVLKALSSIRGVGIWRPSVEQVAEVVDRIYVRLLNVFDLQYQATAPGREGKISLYSPAARGDAEFLIPGA